MGERLQSDVASPAAPATPRSVGEQRRAEPATAAVLCMVASVFCYASVPVFLRHFVDLLDAWTVNGIRYSVGALIWLPFVVVLLRKVDGGRRVWRDALAPTAVNLCGQIGWAFCPYHNSPSVIAFVIRISFLFAILFGFLILPEERLLAKRPLFWWGVGGCVAGLVVMYLEGFLGAGGTTPLGLAIIVVTAIFWGAYAVSIQRWLSAYPARLSFGVISLYTAAVLVALMFSVGEYRQLAALSAKNWALLALSAMLGIAFAHVLSYRAIHRLGPIVTSGGSLCAPFVTFLCAWVVLEDQMTLLQWCGGGILIVGGLFLVWAKAQLERARSPERIAP